MDPEADAHIDLIQPGYEDLRVPEGGQVLQSQDVSLLEGILGQELVLEIPVREPVLIRVSGHIQLREGVTVALLGAQDQLGEIFMIQVGQVTRPLS